MALFRIMGIIVLILGIRMAGEGIYHYIDENHQKDWIPATAYVVDISSEYSSSSTRYGGRIRYEITYQYEVDGKEYSDKLYNRSRVMGLGDKIKIKYDPTAPEDSTDILSPSLYNLIVFLVSGAIFVTMGFFLSGAWALIRKIRRRGEPEEEEILPPEEYVKPEEMKKMPLNPALAIVCRIAAVGVVFGGVFLSTKLFPGAQAVDTEQFKKAAKAAGYTTIDTSEELRQSWKVGSMLEEAASFDDGNIRMDFVVMDTTGSASVLFDGMALPVSDGEVKEHSGNIHELYSIENDTQFAVKARISDTVIYAFAQAGYQTEVVELLEELGYWKE